MSVRRPVAEMSALDAAIWHTVDINQAIDARRLDSRPYLATYFPLLPGEKVLSQGGFTLLDYQSVGDGSYLHNSSYFYASGGLGAAMTLGFAASRAAGNSRRRRAALAAATPRWLAIDSGELHVSTHRLCFQSAGSFYGWTYDAIDVAQLAGPEQMHFSGTTEDGRRISWILDSVWAALAFTLWARSRHPHHPQFTGRTWIPAGWADRVRATSYGLPEPG